MWRFLPYLTFARPSKPTRTRVSALTSRKRLDIHGTPRAASDVCALPLCNTDHPVNPPDGGELDALGAQLARERVARDLLQILFGLLRLALVPGRRHTFGMPRPIRTVLHVIVGQACDDHREGYPSNVERTGTRGAPDLQV
jgi:hypothetical protein